MSGPEAAWTLATIAGDAGDIACVGVGGSLYKLAPSLARVGLNGMDSVIGLFDDWPRSRAALDACVTHVQTADIVSGGTRRAPLMYPGKILCAGANYFDHLAEMGMPNAKKADQRLFFFMKPPRNAVVGEGSTVRVPLGSQAFDWEIELAAVIGTTARNVPVETALSHVACYTVTIDFSARDHNRAPETFYKLDWVAGKANDTCCPMGPVLVPAEAIGNPQDIGLKLWVNGELKQDGRSTDMIFSIAEQISIASRIMTLDPGDLLLTGTPAGVGVPKQTFLKAGDKVDAEIEGIGRLSVIIQPPG
jgi:2-keto-4-pentenoate hydratase/2-oxohepta-3-ene-1,7-dioic acid hydratase in catechol pathway